MPVIELAASALLVIDFQTRLLPAIHEGVEVVAQARRLLAVADMLAVPVVFTEQNAGGLGGTVPELPPHGPVLHKMTFDACRSGAAGMLAERRDIVVAGCEAHVCVLQTVLGLLDAGRRAYVVQDAVGARRPDSKAAALRRMERHSAEIVTAEMVIFEWLGGADHPRFRDALALVK